MAIDIVLALSAMLLASSLWRRRRRRECAIEQFRTGRASLEAGVVYRRATADDGELIRRLDVAAADVRELERLGFRALGELCIAGVDGAVRSVQRVFVDERGTTLATILSSARGTRGDFELHLDSVTREDEFTTARRKLHAGFARPPFFHLQNAPDTATVGELVALHAEFAKPSEPDRITFTSLDQLIGELERSRRRKVEWRGTQAPDELLEADLHGLLPPALHGRIDKQRLRDLREVPPTATVRRR